LCNSKICNPWHGSSQRKELSQLTPHWSIPPFNNWHIWESTQTSWYVFTWLWQCHLELKRAKGPGSLYWLFCFITKFQSHCKGSNDNRRFSYFQTPTPLGCTSFHHSQFITDGRFLTWRNTIDLLQKSIFDMETFWHLIWTNLTSCKFHPFSFFLFLCTFSKSMVCLN
jgi:hypothetical protein